jgi:hypothetical protein
VASRIFLAGVLVVGILSPSSGCDTDPEWLMAEEFALQWSANQLPFGAENIPEELLYVERKLGASIGDTPAPFAYRYLDLSANENAPEKRHPWLALLRNELFVLGPIAASEGSRMIAGRWRFDLQFHGERHQMGRPYANGGAVVG